MTDHRRIGRSAGTGDRADDQQTAILAHELRRPLGAVLSALRVMRHDGTGAPAAGLARDRAERQARHMARIIEDVLAVCRSGHVRPRLRKQRVNLAAVVIDAVETVRPLFTGRGLHVAVALPPEPVSLLADPSRLHQVLTNLLTNAAEYTDPGGKICLAADVDGDDLVLRVSDNGRGIAPELLPHVFDLFRRDDRPADRSCGGLGVGLAVAKALVEQHGGGIAAFSDGPGAGSEFVVRLPDCAPRVDADQVPEAFAVFSAAALIGPLLGVASGHGAQFLLAAAVVAVAAIFQFVRRRRAHAVERWQAALDAFVARETARDRLGDRTPRRTAHLRGGFPWR